MKKIVLAIAVLALAAHAQFTELYSILVDKTNTAVNIMASIDVEHMSTSYQAYMLDGKATIYDLENGQTDATFDLSAVKSGYLYFYKNFLKKDGKWTVVIFGMFDGVYKLYLMTDGVLTDFEFPKLTVSSAGNLIEVNAIPTPPVFTIKNGKMYMSVLLTAAISNYGQQTVYLVRNNVSSSSISKTAGEIKLVNSDAAHYNAIGQQIPEDKYQNISDELKRTLFSK